MAGEKARESKASNSRAVPIHLPNSPQLSLRKTHKAPPALLTTVRGQALHLLSLFPPSQQEGASPRRGMERRDGAVTRDMHRHVPHAGRGVRTLSGECTPPGAPSRRCFPSRAARLGVHVRLAPTRACERIANRSLCRWADPRDARELELRCLKPAGAAVPAPPPDASPETTTPLTRSGNGGRLARRQRRRED
jgi:hypothetical protein